MKKWDIYYFFHFSFTITHNFQRWNKVVFTYVSKCCKHVRWHQDVEENSAICPLFLREEVSWKLFDGSWSTVDKGVQFPSTNCKWTKNCMVRLWFSTSWDNMEWLKYFFKAPCMSVTLTVILTKSLASIDYMYLLDFP